MMNRNGIWRPLVVAIVAAGSLLFGAESRNGSASLRGEAHAAEISSAEVIARRKLLMKSVGEATKVVGEMIRGLKHYDPLVAGLAVRTIHAVSIAFPHQFPDGTQTGGETEAGARIWQERGAFVAASDELESLASQAVPTVEGGGKAFSQAFAALAKTCKACHRKFREKR